MKEFNSFDPLACKSTTETLVAAHALKREITNILSSYVGWYDPFCELIQNALDAVEEKASISDKSYIPKLSITIDVADNSLIVSDNGIGLDYLKFSQFLAPCFSFKSGGNTRGHKGVGATYLAYGFNYIHISTKTADFSSSGKMVGARNWLTDLAPAGNPQITFDPKGAKDPKYADFPTGVSIEVKFDGATHPKSLSWLKAEDAAVWKKILLIKTGLGAFLANKSIKVDLRVIDSKGKETQEHIDGVEYLWPHSIVAKSINYRSLSKIVSDNFQKHGADFKTPSSIKNIEAIYDTFSKEEIIEHLDFSQEEIDVINLYDPSVYFSYMYTAKVWNQFNDGLDIRKNHSILLPGIQICANKMPQGEVIEIPLNRNIGRQRQVSVVVHFNNCSPDMGRKGFQKEVVEIALSIGRKIIEDLIPKYKKYLRVVTGVAPDLLRQKKVNDWKSQITEHENKKPILLKNKNFFMPVNSISVTSEPTREQDVIALFNQLIAGGVIRGIKIMSTNEFFTYDGMFRACYVEPSKFNLYDSENNPLGVDSNYIDAHSGFISDAMILEYKFSLDGLIENIQDGSKNSNDIDLVVVWETGVDYLGNYSITSLLNPDNLAERQYHGVTHIMTNETTGQKEMDLVVLKELIDYLNDPVVELENQIIKYG
jgi:hypothetical protein